MKRAECRPPDSLAYLKMKIGHIEKSGQPKRHIQTIDKVRFPFLSRLIYLCWNLMLQAAVKYKPVTMHEEDIARMKQKKV